MRDQGRFVFKGRFCRKIREDLVRRMNGGGGGGSRDDAICLEHRGGI